MKERGQSSGQPNKAQLWDAASALTSMDSDLRDQALEDLSQVDGYLDSPLIAYILVTRINEPDLEVRYHVVQLLGGLLGLGSEDPSFSDRILELVHYHLKVLNQVALIHLLEVHSKYLSAEEAVCSIMKLVSYAGNELSGIVNDRKQPVRIRQQAIYFCGKLGYLATRETLQTLVRRVEKAGSSPQKIRSRADEEELYPYAVAALAKLSL